MLNLPIARVELSLKGWSVEIDGKLLPFCYETEEEAQFVASLLLTQPEDDSTRHRNEYRSTRP